MLRICVNRSAIERDLDISAFLTEVDCELFVVELAQVPSFTIISEFTPDGNVNVLGVDREEIAWVEFHVRFFILKIRLVLILRTVEPTRTRRW